MRNFWHIFLYQNFELFCQESIVKQLIRTRERGQGGEMIITFLTNAQCPMPNAQCPITNHHSAKAIATPVCKSGAIAVSFASCCNF
jgi:hypothetical protein